MTKLKAINGFVFHGPMKTKIDFSMFNFNPEYLEK